MTENNKIKNIGDMTIGSEGKCIVMFAIPLLIGNVFQQLYSTIDGIVVGQIIGDAALAGVGASFPILFLLVALLMGVGMGATVLISQFYGAKDYENVMKVVNTILIMSVLISALLGFIGFMITDWILSLLRTPPEAMPYASIFLKVNFAGIIGMAGYNLTSSILRGLGDSKTPLYFLMISTVINLILLLIFVIPLQMGVFGAALATVIAQMCSFVFAIIWLNKTHALIKIDIFHMKFDIKMFKEALRIGIPSGVQQSLVGVSMIVIQAVINPFGTAVVAGVTAASRIQQFSFMPIMSINMSISAFTGQNIGAGKLERVHSGYKVALKMSFAIAIALTIICIVFGTFLVGLFNSNPEVIKVGHEFLMIVMPFTLPSCVLFMSMGVVRGAGDAISSMIVSLVALWFVRIPAALILPNFIGYPGVFLANGLDWLVGAIIAYWYYKSNRWQKKISINRFKEEKCE